MSNNRNVYLYWIGKEYKLISIFRDLIYLHSNDGIGYNVILITEKNIKEYIKDIPDYFNTLHPAHQADFVRVHVICDYGGIWLDSDTLVINNLYSLFDLIENKNGFFIKENNKILCNGVFGSKKQTPLMIEWKNNLMKVFNKKKNKLDWAEVGCQMLKNMYNMNKSLYDDYKIFKGLNNMYPVNWKKCVNEFIKKPYDNYKNIIREYQPLVVLVNSVYKELENKTEKEILEGNMPINYFINKSKKKIMINIFVISLKYSNERRNKILKEIKKYGYNAIVIDAVDGKYNNLRLRKEYNSIMSKILSTRDMLSTEIGCFLSHIKTYEKIINLNSDINLILEDDCLFNDEINNLLKKIKEIKELPFELVRIIPKKDSSVYFLEKKINSIEFNRIRGNIGGSYSYFISLEGAKKLYYQTKYLFVPIDLYFNYQFLTGIDKIFIFPSCSNHSGEFDSTISKSKDMTDRGPDIDNIIFYITKFFFRNIIFFLFNICYYNYYFLLNKIVILLSYIYD